MNFTQLARILRISPQELREKLPLLGFDIGLRAIKVDERTANKIIKLWPTLIRELEAKQIEEKQIELKDRVKKEIKIPAFITVRDLSAVSGIPVSKVLTELIKNNVFVSLNEKIDFETAAIIGADLGLEVKLEEKKDEQEEDKKIQLKEIMDQEKTEDLISRPPIIVVMGHVDHGKTKLLDAIRSTNVMGGEAGGITQHIGAYQIKRNEKFITFIDTPGHEAFTAMRSRGAKVADIAILVIAADDGVKPQTVEAYNIIKAAQIPFIVAINKIDKPEANVEKVKQELSNQLGLLPEDWGGKVVCALISAKEGKGIEELLDIVLLSSEVESGNMKANPNALATGTVVESRVDKGEGPVATILIQNGTLHVGDELVYNNQFYGKARALKNFKGESIQEAGPSMPVKIIGLKVSPAVGDILQVGKGERTKIKKAKNNSSSGDNQKPTGLEKEDDVKKINVIIKSDFLGSAEAIAESLEKINTEEIKIDIIHRGLGNITEGDVSRAESTGAQIIGFNIKLPPYAEELARTKNIKVKIYNIIYNLINDLKKEMEEVLGEETQVVELGKLKVLAIFRTENKSQIVGGKIMEGEVEAKSLIRVRRAEQLIAQGKLARLQAGKQDVKKAVLGEECGILYEGQPIIKVGDTLEFYKEIKVRRKL
jgi:translation initiation factor IF-2